MIKLRLFPVLAKQSRSGKVEQEIAFRLGMTAGDILQREGFDGVEAMSILVVVNDQQVSHDTPLRDGDLVELMLAVEGG